MRPAAISVPKPCTGRVGSEIVVRIFGVGEAALLAEPLLGFIASRECPGSVLLEILERVPEWARAGRVIVGGFHSPLEQQVLRSVLRRQGRAVKVLARGFGDPCAVYRPTLEEREPLAGGRMLIISAFANSVVRTTRATALARNRLVLALATDIVMPYVAAGSPLEALVAAYQLTGRQCDEH